MRAAYFAVCAVLTAAVSHAGAQSFVEFVGSSRLTAKATAFGAQDAFDSAQVALRPGITNENILRAMGVERGVCGVSGRPGQSIAKTSAQFVPASNRFELELVTALKVQGGISAQGQEQQVPLGPKICIPGPVIETPAGAEAASEATVEIRFNHDTEPGNYWLDLAFASRNPSGERRIELRGPDGETIIPVSGEPVLLWVVPGTSWFLKAAFRDTAHDAGKCCGKDQQATLSVSAAVRPAANILKQEASGNVPDQAGQFSAVGLLVSLNAKGEPVPVCVGTVVGRSTVLTAAHCLLRFGFGADRPTPEKPLWFVQNANVQAGLRRDLVNVVGWSTRVNLLGLGIEAMNETKAGNRSKPYSQARDDLAVLYVEGELGTRAVSHDGRTPLDSLLSRTRSVGTLVTYGPSAETAKEDRSAVSWVRGLVDVQIMSDARPNELLVRAVSRQCGADAGSPVFVTTGGGKMLVGIVASGAKDCQLKAGPGMEGHLDWLRSRIDRRVQP